MFNDVYQYTRNLCVLYVEDEADIRASTCRLLEQYFAKVDTASNGREGLERYHQKLSDGQYDIVISDIHMPHLTGLEMVRAIRNHCEQQYVIFMISQSEKECFPEAIKLGVNHYLLKPVERDELTKVLYQSVKNIINQQKISAQEIKEKQRIERNEHYHKALLQWSAIDFEDTDNSIKELTKLSATALNTHRVSFWLFNKEHTAIACKALYLLDEKTHYPISRYDKKHFSVFFEFVDGKRILNIDDVKNDVRTTRFNKGYFKPLNIYSVLIVPVIQNQQCIGVISCESIATKRHWTFEEQEFITTMANNLALSLEVKKRYKVQKKLKKRKNKIAYQTHHDPLTALPNRTLFMDRLEQAIKQNRRNKSKVALLFIDLDRFKEINDSLGHETGDQVLKIISQRLLTRIRDSDTLARLGGDEFTIILDNINDIDIISRIIQKLMTCTQEAICINEQMLYVTLSIGVSIFPDDGLNAEVLLKNADVAMYKAKDGGRNSYEYYEVEMTQKAVDRLVMEAHLRQAINKEEFFINYQPQFDALTDQLIGMEALIRWQNNKLGMISPDKFIPFAEELGLIVAIDRWVMETAMKQFAQWYQQGFNPGRLSLNLAMKQLQDETCTSFLKSLLEKYQFCKNWLELEITEGRIMKDPESAIKTLWQIKELGISLAIDDFGTGYSSLSYLKRLPIDTLKIDRAFIMSLPNDDEDAAISKAIIALGKSLNLDVIAEGVETQEQKNFLVDNGCPWIQGYYYSRPLIGDDMQILLKKAQSLQQNPDTA